MAQLIEYLIFIMQMLHKYEILVITDSSLLKTSLKHLEI